MKNLESDCEDTPISVLSQGEKPQPFDVDREFGEFTNGIPLYNQLTDDVREIIQEAWKHGNSCGRNDFAEELERLVSRADTVE